MSLLRHPTDLPLHFPSCHLTLDLCNGFCHNARICLKLTSFSAFAVTFSISLCPHILTRQINRAICWYLNIPHSYIFEAKWMDIYISRLTLTTWYREWAIQGLGEAWSSIFIPGKLLRAYCPVKIG